MVDKKYLPKTYDEYVDAFRVMAALADAALDHVEKISFSSKEERAKVLCRAAELVESVATIRGDSGLLYDIRPATPEESFQSEMYSTEDYLRDRLVRLGYKYIKMPWESQLDRSKWVNQDPADN